MVANQPMRCTTSSGLQPIAASATRAARTARGLRTADLLRPSAAEQGLDLTGARRLGRHENAELVVREARIVGDRAEPAGGEQRVEGDAENRRERAEQDRHLEQDHAVRRDRADRLAAKHERPIVRHVQRDPGADRAARDPADQREHPHGAHRLLECILDLVPGDRRVHGEVGVAGPAQLADRVHRRVDVAEHAQHTRRGRRVEDGGQRVRELHDTLALPRCGAGSTSFTSEIDTVGKFFTNNRNHMKNQPKLPAMMPQSAHVGLYVALANRSYGSPASDTTMITKRSNHMPMFTKIEITNSARMLVRIGLNHRSCGKKALQMIIVHDAHQNGPNARYQNAARSAGWPPNQAVKNSTQYAYATIMPVRRHSFARFSKWWTVMSSSRWNSLRIGTSSVITIATPE